MFNITNCRRVFDYCTVPFRRVLKLFYYGMTESIKKCRERRQINSIKDEKKREEFKEELK